MNEQPDRIDAPPGRGISVIVPVFNSETTVPALVEQVAAALRPQAIAFEIILVNDDSRDGSWERIREAVRQQTGVRGIDLMRNYGQHNALLCGIRHAAYDVIVTLDDDLQHSPADIPALLQKLAEGHDVVYGTPHQPQHGLWRTLAAQLTKIALQSAMGAETARRVSAFRVFRTKLRDAFASYGGPFVSIDVLLTWGTTRFAHVFVHHEPRRHGASNYTLRKLLVHALNMVTGFSTLPLHLASILGPGLTLLGVVILLVVLVRSLLDGDASSGFALLASLITILAGVQLFALGMIGEYLGRVHFRLMDRPSFVVREAYSREEKP